MRLGRFLALLSVPVDRPLIMAALIGLCVFKLVIVPAFYNLDMPTRLLPYGFGAPTEAVATTGSLLVCPENTLQGYCKFAARMPLIPYFFAGASKILGDNVLLISLFKTMLLDSALLYFISRFLTIVGADRLVFGLLATVFAGPQFMLHSTVPYYEEGFLTQLLAILMVIQLAYALKHEDELASWAWLPAYLIVITAIYLLKSSMILVVVWSAIFLCCFAPLSTPVRLLAAATLCIPPLLWGAVVDHMTGRFSVGTSIDGLNLLEGNNPVTLDFYPRYTTDIIIGDGTINLDGRTVERLHLGEFDPRFVRRTWVDEWQLDDAYRDAAIAWAAHNIPDELRLAAQKLAVFFVDVRNRPLVPDGRKPASFVLLAGMAWMITMRLVMWSAIIAALRAIRRRSPNRLAGLCFLALLGSYAAPYIVGFAFERHVVPILLPAALLLAFVWRRRSVREHGETATAG